MTLAPGVNIQVTLHERGFDLAVTVPNEGTFRWRMTLCTRCDGWVVEEGPDAALVPANYPGCICPQRRCA